MEQSAKERAAEEAARIWAARITKTLLSLRDELWTGLNAVKCEGDPRRELHWNELDEVRIGKRLPDAPPPPRRPSERSKEKPDRAAETRWRRHLRPGDPSSSVPDAQVMGEALALLSKMRHRLPESVCPRVWQLLKDDQTLGEHFHDVFYPASRPHQEVGGLTGSWRMVHQQSSGKAYLSWRIRVEPGPDGARFTMATDATRPRRLEGPRTPTENVSGNVHASGALFSFLGFDQDGRPVSASFQSPGGHVPSASFGLAYGLVQRVGSSGLYSARAVLTRAEVSDEELGSFNPQDVQGRSVPALEEDMATIASSVSPGIGAIIVSLLSAPDK